MKKGKGTSTMVLQGKRKMENAGKMEYACISVRPGNRPTDRK